MYLGRLVPFRLPCAEGYNFSDGEFYRDPIKDNKWRYVCNRSILGLRRKLSVDLEKVDPDEISGTVFIDSITGRHYHYKFQITGGEKPELHFISHAYRSPGGGQIRLTKKETARAQRSVLEILKSNEFKKAGEGILLPIEDFRALTRCVSHPSNY